MSQGRGVDSQTGRQGLAGVERSRPADGVTRAIRSSTLEAEAESAARVKSIGSSYRGGTKGASEKRAEGGRRTT